MIRLLAILGFALLYVPLAVLIIYSFNASQLVSVWGGWSTRWYGELWSNDAVLDAALVSLQVAVLSASIGTIFGTLIGYILSRFGGFRLRMLFTAMTTAPIVMPEVVTGLSLLLLFISMEQLFGWPQGRSVTTIVIAHATFGMAFVAVVIQARLAGFDRSIEEAARDLGARPVRIFMGITLPVIAPALISGWLLAFTLSLDDLVIASFVSGQGSSTLPMVIYSKVRLGVSPDVNALGTLVILVVATGLILGALIMSRAEARRRRSQDRS
ncbi:ABC transporter permease subunit [Pontivivens insulae]|uniref:Inner membrane ABC transporter permease protein YdcV n=1 Tax=Pontivivens insulae TaxID=1639689 RepID=A0A2R8ACX5_9RHOB|nr:ABC transporter permease subunit [Pontivivens insulae]RED14019.1 ABC-type spermidine/putrescine transport system permease subunit II [Pontivivens insulae]SPF30093.1 Inner membrane ABC transporter permease protein YdcV [Pontivivens insulae]